MKFQTLPLLTALLMSTFLAPLSFADASTNNPIKAHLQGALKKSAKAQMVPGAVVFVHRPRGNISISYGTSQLGKDLLPKAITQFRIGSNTKSMISAVIVQLAQEGALNLDDPVANYIPGVPNGENISLDLLMKNRSGLANYLQSPEIAKAFDANPSKIWKPEELLALSFEQVQAAPDKKFDYSNTNFILLGLIAEKLEKKSLSVIFRERLFEPLGMKHTYLPEPSETQMTKPFAHGYAYGKSAHVFTHVPYSSKMQQAIKHKSVLPKDYTIQSASWSWAAGGVVSNAKDLATWIEALSEGKLFKPEFYKRWKNSPVSSDETNPNVKYGYGFMTIKNDFGLFYFHSGELPGFNSYMIYHPKLKQAITMWANLTLSPSTEPTAGPIKSAIFDLLYTPKK
ncbi:MAG: beta-lactamase family protein [Tatlockia sp.]|nr:beta-lactamase family protein [Tatlockia sp.]